MKKIIFNQNSHTFRTEKNQKMRKLRFWVLLSAAVVLILGSISVLILLKNYNYNISNIVGESTTETTEETSSDAPPVVKGDADILLALHDGDELKFACIIKANSLTRSFSVCTYDIDTKTDGKTLAQKYKSVEKNLRMEEFKKVMSSVSGISIDRYISADYSQFTQAISLMGGVTMRIPKDISYDKGDIVLSLKKGEWKLIGPNLLNYILVSNRSTRNEIIMAMIDEYFNPKNYENAERIYQKLVNILDTDITAFDFNSALPALEALSLAEDELTITSFTPKG